MLFNKEIIAGFATAHAGELSEQTIRGYVGDLRRCAHFLREREKVDHRENVTPRHIHHLLEWEAELGRRPGT